MFTSYRLLLVGSSRFEVCQDVMQDPVVAADGTSYERHAIERWLERGSVPNELFCPMFDLFGHVLAHKFSPDRAFGTILLHGGASWDMRDGVCCWT